MKQFKDKVIIGIDHGYGNIKTANHIFRTGVMHHLVENHMFYGYTEVVVCATQGQWK